MKWSDKIKELRNKLFITQAELGEMLGTSFSTVNRWEQDLHEPTMKMKRKLSDLFKKNDIDMEEVQLLVENLIHDNARRNQDQEEYERHYQKLVGQFNAAKTKMESLLEEKQSKLDRIEILNAFIVSLEDKAVIIDEF